MHIAYAIKNRETQKYALYVKKNGNLCKIKHYVLSIDYDSNSYLI